ncbi:MAG: hydantoinase/oxoprolinase family protein, partial [Dehalococcoidia bacterium]
TNRLELHKLLTTPDRPADAVIEGISVLLTRLGAVPSDVELIVHGTTLASNALIERTGARTGLITTAGFRDVLEIGTEQRYDLYDLHLTFPEPLAPRDRRVEVAERTARDGTVLRALNPADLRQALDELASSGVEAVAIAFLNSYRNPANEQAAGRLTAASWPGVALTLSSEVSPEIREYERVSTAVANAYLQPVVAAYLGDLAERLQAAGFGQRLLLMLSNGGSGTVELGRRQPVRLLESGPAAGITAAAHLAAHQNLSAVLSFDMGGTTAKVCLIREGEIARTSTLEVARVHRFKPGSGLPIRTAAVDVLEVGGGGGSIAALDELGLLRVGPRSAGADPGPASYGRGGDRPTVTDANLVLGYLDPGYFLGGRLALDPAAAKQAIAGSLSALGPVDQAAWGIHSLVNEQMASAIRVHCAERGADPRRSALLAFGGAGPAHAGRIARSLGISRVLFPPAAGVNSAFGFLVAPVGIDLARSLPSPLEAVDWPAVEALFEGLREDAERALAGADVPLERTTVRHHADLALAGQSHDLTIEIPAPPFSEMTAEEIGRRFRDTYRRRYRRLPEGFGINVVTWRLRLEEQRDAEAWDVPRDETGPARKRDRRAYFPEAGGWLNCPVYERRRLALGERLAGPAIVEEAESTALILPGTVATVLADGAILMEADA